MPRAKKAARSSARPLANDPTEPTSAYVNPDGPTEAHTSPPGPTLPLPAAVAGLGTTTSPGPGPSPASGVVRAPTGQLGPFPGLGSGTPVAVLRADALQLYLAAKERLAGLEAEAKSLKESLVKAEAGFVAALESGTGAPPGWRVEVKETTTISPAWKAIALAAAVARGEDPKEFEEGVRRNTAPSIRKSLVVERG